MKIFESVTRKSLNAPNNYNIHINYNNLVTIQITA